MKAIENFSGNPLYRLLSFEELPQLYKELILSCYGTPYTDRPAGDRTVPGKDPLSGIFGADSEPRTDHPEKDVIVLKQAVDYRSELLYRG